MRLKTMQYIPSDTNNSSYNSISTIPSSSTRDKSNDEKSVTVEITDCSSKNMSMRNMKTTQISRKSSKIPVRQRPKLSCKTIENVRNAENSTDTSANGGNEIVSIDSVENLSIHGRLNNVNRPFRKVNTAGRGVENRENELVCYVRPPAMPTKGDSDSNRQPRYGAGRILTDEELNGNMKEHQPDAYSHKTYLMIHQSPNTNYNVVSASSEEIQQSAQSTTTDTCTQCSSFGTENVTAIDETIPILEAPEEFRCGFHDTDTKRSEKRTKNDCFDAKMDLNGQQRRKETADDPEGSLSDAAYREVVGIERPTETRSTVSGGNYEQRRTGHQSTPAASLNLSETTAKDSTATQPCDQYNTESRDEDNDHVQQYKQQHEANNTFLTKWHVGSTTPSSDTRLKNASASAMSSIISENLGTSFSKTDRGDGITSVASETVETKKSHSASSVRNIVCEDSGDAVTLNEEAPELFYVGSSVTAVIANVGLCAGFPQTPPTMGPSIRTGVSLCAQAPGCSRDSAAKVCAIALYCEPSAHTSNNPTDTSFINNAENVGSTNADRTTLNEIHQDNLNVCDSSSDKKDGSDTILKNVNKTTCSNTKEVLCWSFRNGRLVFDVALNQSESAINIPEQVVDPNETHNKENTKISERSKKSTDTNDAEILSSKNLNKRRDEGWSRIKYVGLKLKEAGLIDKGITGQPKYTQYTDFIENTTPSSPTKTAIGANYDANQNIVSNCPETIEDDEDIIPEGSDIVDFTGNLCEFDVRQIAGFPGFNANYKVYDALDEDSDEYQDDDEHYILINKHKMRGDGGNSMVSDGDRAKHNPDRDNLKSLLKKPGKSKDTKRSNRVVFNENKNEFFDADYIILIREECDYDDEDDDSVCTCNQHEMVRLTCCEPNCNCNAYGDGYDQTPQSPKFAPPIEFVDAVTLSPPEGYKDMELGEQQLLALQQISRTRGQRTAVCRECSATHEDEHDGEETKKP